jgi:hypothetical protein
MSWFAKTSGAIGQGWQTTERLARKVRIQGTTTKPIKDIREKTGTVMLEMLKHKR